MTENMTYDEALDRFDGNPSQETCADLLEVGATYHGDEMIRWGTFKHECVETAVKYLRMAACATKGKAVNPPPSGERVNGYPIVATFPTKSAFATRAGRYIMVDRGEASPHRWVVAWQGDGDEGWHHGHYHNDEIEARALFLEKCSRELLVEA